MNNPLRASHLTYPRQRGMLLTCLVLGSAGLAIWTVYLAIKLPQHYIAAHWVAAWVGLDSLEALALLATTWAAFRRRVVLVFFATSAATMILLDAWFDVTTARKGSFRESLIGALVVEIPASIVLYWMAATTLRRSTKSWLTGVRSDTSLWRLEIPRPSTEVASADATI